MHALSAHAISHEDDPLPSRVFVSYHRRTPRAHRLARVIRGRIPGAGGAFLDEHDIQEGDEWAARIHDYLFDCDAAVVLLSRDGCRTSEWLVHEAALLRGRHARWGDLVLFVVALDLDPGELHDPDSPVHTLAPVQVLDARGLTDESVVDHVLSDLRQRWSELRPRLRRRAVVSAILGASSARASRFVKEIRRRLPDDPAVIDGVLGRLSLPCPPRDASVDRRLYLARLLLAHPAPGRVLAALAEAGHEREADRVQRYLGLRGYLDSKGPIAYVPALRFAWSLRRWFLTALVLAIPIGYRLLRWAEEWYGERVIDLTAPWSGLGALGRAFLLALGALALALLLLAVVTRLVEALLWITIDRRKAG